LRLFLVALEALNGDLLDVPHHGGSARLWRAVFVETGICGRESVVNEVAQNFLRTWRGESGESEWKVAVFALTTTRCASRFPAKHDRQHGASLPSCLPLATSCTVLTRLTH
jgi:hypothetical protein